MKRVSAFTALLLILCLASSASFAAVEVKMVGDARVYGDFFANQNFTGWNADGTQTEDTFLIYQRFRLRTDFVANENLKFRFGVRVNDTPWGGANYTVDNPSVNIQVYQAYLQFKWPETNVQITAGYQPLSLPQSAIFYDSAVLSNKHASSSTAALVITAPLVEDTLSMNVGFARLVDTNEKYDPTTTQVSDEIDAYFLTLPLTMDGFSVTPWALLSVVGKGATGVKDGIRNNLVAAGSFFSPTGYSDNQTFYWWAGGAVEVDALDPVKFYADVIYGEGAMSGAKKNRRRGWFMDLGAEYVGLDFMTPQLGAWWSTGEDDSVANGSERMPAVKSNFGMGGTFLFASDQPLSKNVINADPHGAWGVTASLKDISWVEDLSHRITFTAMNGTSTTRGIRRAVLASGGNGEYLTMGKNLTNEEWLTALSFDTKYMLYKNLALYVETGWANFSGYKSSTWNTGRNFTGNVQDAWKCLFGFIYKF